MPRLKSFSQMLASEKDETMDKFRAEFKQSKLELQAEFRQFKLELQAEVKQLKLGLQEMLPKARPASTMAPAPAVKKVVAVAAPKKRGPKPGWKQAAAAQVAQVVQAQATEPKKRGPKPGWKLAKAAQEAAQEAAQAVPPKAKPVTTATVKTKATGVPRLIDAIQIVMGKKTMNAKEVHAELKTKGWLPNSNDPLGYIRYTLSVTKDTFLRVEGQRGYYHLGSGSKVAAPAKPKVIVTPKAEVLTANGTVVKGTAVKVVNGTNGSAVKANGANGVSKAVNGTNGAAIAAPEALRPVEDPVALADDVLSKAGIDLGSD